MIVVFNNFTCTVLTPYNTTIVIDSLPLLVLKKPIFLFTSTFLYYLLIDLVKSL